MGKIEEGCKATFIIGKKEMYKTGGGIATKFKPIKEYEKIVELLGASASGLDSNFDFDLIGKFHF